MSKLKETLAAVQHEIWSQWMKHLFSSCVETKKRSIYLDLTQVERWKRQMNTPYEDLTEKEKDLDREQAAKILTVLDPEMKEKLYVTEPEKPTSTFKLGDRVKVSYPFDGIGTVTGFESGQVDVHITEYDGDVSGWSSCSTGLGKSYSVSLASVEHVETPQAPAFKEGDKVSVRPDVLFNCVKGKVTEVREKMVRVLITHSTLKGYDEGNTYNMSPDNLTQAKEEAPAPVKLPFKNGSRVRVRRFGITDFSEKIKGTVVARNTDRGIYHVDITDSEVDAFQEQQIYGFEAEDMQLLPLVIVGAAVSVTLPSFTVLGNISKVYPEGFVSVFVHTSDCPRFCVECEYILQDRDLEFV